MIDDLDHQLRALARLADDDALIPAGELRRIGDRRKRVRRAVWAGVVVAACVTAAVAAPWAVGSGRTARQGVVMSPGPSTPAPKPVESPCGVGAAAVGNCLVAISFVDGSDGFGVYAPDHGGSVMPLQIVATQDAGRSWTEVASSPIGGSDPTTFPGLLFVTRADGFVFNDSGLFTTHDGGKTWHPARVAGQVVDVTHVGENVWAAYTSCPQIPTSSVCGVGVEASSDAGRTWRQLSLPYPPYRSAQIRFGANGHAYIGQWASSHGSQDAGRLLVSDDGGVTWLARPLPCPVGYRLGGQLSVDATTDTVWMVCGGQVEAGNAGIVMYRSIDEGRTWIPESSLAIGAPTGVRAGAPSGKLTDLVATSATEAFGVTVNCGLVQSTDGGTTWHPSGPAGMPEGFLGKLDFVTPQDGWVAFWITVAGNVGLWHTTDGGTTWQPSSAVNLSNVPHCPAGTLSIGEGTRI